jgi:hypothetical protein
VSLLAAKTPAILRATAHAPPPRLSRSLELALLAAAPLLAFLILHLRAMATPVLPDPAMHSVYLWDPGDLARRYRPVALPVHLRNYIGPAGAYFRWGTRPGFLVPGRLAYLAFGPVPGFLVFRYVLALIATVPAYLLGKRSYGVGVGALAVCLVLSSPVVITAWGTDFPDSAAVSYMLAGLACLVMPSQPDAARTGWQLAAAVLLTFAVWSLATTGLLVGLAVVVVAAQAAVQHGARAARTDLLRLAAGAVATTLLLGIASWLVLGRLDYVFPTLQAVKFLDTPAQTALWHSKNWRWVLDDSYLLVLPATCVACATLAVRRRLPSAAAAIAITAAVQLVLAAAGQFGSSLQLLENHYLSSPLWAASLLTLTVVIAELTRPLSERPLARWLPAALVIAAALIVEAAPAVPAFGWWPWGVILAAGVVAVVAIAAWLPRHLAAVGTVVAAGVLAATLVLTIAPNPSTQTLRGAVYDPPTGYEGALGESWQTGLDDYRLEAAVRKIVPNASYQGEQLVDSLPHPSPLGLQLIGLFHTGINYLTSLGSTAQAEIRSRNVAQLVMMAPNQRLNVPILLLELAPLHPRIARFASLRSGTQSVQLAVIDFPAANGPRYRP